MRYLSTVVVDVIEIAENTGNFTQALVERG